MRIRFATLIIVSSSLALCSWMACGGSEPSSAEDAHSDAAKDINADTSDDRTETDGAIDVMSDATVCLTGMIAWWKGDNDPKDELNTIPLTSIGNVGYEVAKVGNGFSFDGGGRLLGDAAALHNMKTFSLEGWVTYTGPGFEGVPTYSTIVSLGPIDSGGPVGFEVGLWPNFASNWIDIHPADNIGGVGAPVPNGLFHFAVTYDPTSTVKVYVDGKEQNSRPAPPLTSFDPVVGVAGRVTGEHRAFGIIDELSIYDVVLTAAQVKAIAGGNKIRCP